MDNLPLYLGNASSRKVRRAMHRGELGMMCTDAEHRTPITAHDHQPVWHAYDNGGFGARGNLDTDRWLRWLTEMVAGREHRCLFAVAPDVFNPDLGDRMGAVSLAYSRTYLADVRALDIPVALVAQNGLTPDMVPWPEMDWIFIGGTTPWKISLQAETLAMAALRHGKRVHMGRVNSATRLAVARSFGCATCDGTFLANGPDINLLRLRRWYTHTPTPTQVRRYLARQPSCGPEDYLALDGVA